MYLLAKIKNTTKKSHGRGGVMGVDYAINEAFIGFNYAVAFIGFKLKRCEIRETRKIRISRVFFVKMWYNKHNLNEKKHGYIQSN